MNAKKVFLIIQSLILVSALSLNTAFAEAKEEGKSPIVITLSLKRVVTAANGKEKLEDAPKIKPGELLEYRAVYQNKSKNDVSGLVASLPVPAGLEYVKQTAVPANVEATIDNIKYAAEPLMRTVKDANGKEQQEEVPYVEYRSLRWQVGELGAGKKIEVSARMKASELPKSPEELINQPAIPMLVK